MAPTIGPFAKTVGPYLPFQSIVRASTSIGTVSNISIDTPGQITLVGQQVDVRFGAVYASINRNVGPALPFKAVQRGYTTPANTNFNFSIDTPGQITLTGQSIQVDVQSPRISAVKWDPGPYFEFSQRRYGHTALAFSNLSVPIDTAGQITLAGQPIGMNLNVPVLPGQITLTGQSVLINHTFNITAGQITLQGQPITVNVGNSVNIGIQPGLITLAGQDVTVTITDNGQKIDSIFFEADIPGSITFEASSPSMLLRKNRGS